MTRQDYESVLDRMRLQNDILWPIPICLDISETLARTLEAGQSLALRDSEGFLLVVLHIEDMWPVDKEGKARPRSIPTPYITLCTQNSRILSIFLDTGQA